MSFFCHAIYDNRVIIERVDHQHTLSDEEAIQLVDIQNSIPSLTEAILLDIPGNHILFFWAESATFTVERNLERKLHVPGYSCKIIDSKHEIVGKTAPMLSEHYDENGCDTGEWEFIAISRRKLLDFEAVITAIQVRRKHGIAYRMNIGEIPESAWKDSDPVRLLLGLG